MEINNDDSLRDMLYTHLHPQHVEQFYRGYVAWQMRQEIALLEAQCATLDQQINDNAVLMQLVQPSSLSLAMLARLQSYGVEDIDLLDAMLARGDEWLDHAMQLLTQCERLHLIHDNYTEWCRHALEGAYNWLDSINEPVSTSNNIPQSPLHIDMTQTFIDDTTPVDDVHTTMPGNTHDVNSSVSPFESISVPESVENAGTLVTENVAETRDSPDAAGEETAELLLRKLMSDVEDEPANMATNTPVSDIETTTIPSDSPDSLDSPDHPVPTTPIEVATPPEPVTSAVPESSEASTQEIETITPTPSLLDTKSEQQEQQEIEALKEDVAEQKTSGHGLVSRILAKVWNVS